MSSAIRPDQRGSLADLVGIGSGAPERKVVRAAHRQGRPRVLMVNLVLCAATCGVVCLSVSIGTIAIPLANVPTLLFGFGDTQQVFLVTELRLPRVVCGLLVGIAFGVSGAIFQSLVDNELASPDIIGITAGASTAAIFTIVVVGGTATELSFAAWGGALATAALVHALSHRGGVSGHRLILIGIGVAAGLGSITSYLTLRANFRDLQRATIWLTGSLNNRGWDQVLPLAMALIVLIPAAVLLRRAFRGLQLGDDAALGIGVRVGLTKGTILLIGVALAAFATAAAGPVVFVAFVSAPIARRLLGNGDVALLSAGLVGGLLTTGADLLARIGVNGFEVPVGIVTGILGAPYLVWLLIKTNRSSTGY